MTTRTNSKTAGRVVLAFACGAFLACGAQPEAVVFDAVEPQGSAGDGEPFDTLVGEDISLSYELQGDWYVSPVMEAPEGASRVAVHAELRPEQASGTIMMEARGRQADGSWGQWTPVEMGFNEEAFRSGVAAFGFQASAVALRLRSEDAVRVLTLQWAAASAEPESDPGDLSVAVQELGSDLAKLGVISRAQWGARYNKTCGANPTKNRMAIHHTATAATTSAAGIRSIEHFHVTGRGWCDIGYHFLVTQDGRVWEGRRLDRLGGHARNNNSNNIGISLVGCFQPGTCAKINSPRIPPEAMQTATARIIRHLSGRFGIPVDRARIRGHREHSGQNTSCPGDEVLVRLNNILAMAKATPTPQPAQPVGCEQVSRLAGADRYGTAAAISRSLFPNGASSVVIASGRDGSPDALPAGPLARTLGAPLLLTAPDTLPFETAKEIGRLKPQTVFIVGGAGAVSARVESELALRVGSVVRLAGADRYATAARVASAMGAPNGLAFIAAGDGNLVDALAAGSPAGALGAPLLLVAAGGVPEATAQALQKLGVTRTVVVGGPSVVSDAVLSSLPNPTRLSGDDRFKTATAVAAFARDNGVSTSRVYLSRGDKLVDALAASASGRILLLTETAALNAATAAFIRANSDAATLVGGSGALSAAVENGVCKAVAQ